MSENLKKIIILEEKLELFLEENNINNVECENIVLKIKELLKKVSNNDLIYLLENGNGIHEFINVTTYFKKYKINKKQIKADNSYVKEFKKLTYFVEKLREISLCEEEYMYICNKCLVDDISNYLLTNMKNEDIMELSHETDDWNYKLFLFGNLKI